MKALVSLCLLTTAIAIPNDETSNVNTLRRLSSFEESFSHSVTPSTPIGSNGGSSGGNSGGGSGSSGASGRRDISTSVSAHHWPTTIYSPLCEAWAYLDKASSLGETHNELNVGNAFSFAYLDAIVSGNIKGGIDNYSAEEWGYLNSTSLAIEAATKANRIDISNTLDGNLLPLALALRTHAPTCEMQRNLARDAAVRFGLYDVNAANGDNHNGAPMVSAFAIVSRVSHFMTGTNETNGTGCLGSQLVTNADLLSDTVTQLESLSTNETNVFKNPPEQTPLLLPLAGETYHPDMIAMPAIDWDDPFYKEDVEEFYRIKDYTVAILYGQIGSVDFSKFYNALKEVKVRFVVRHMGHVAYEEEVKRGRGTAIPTELQGYGVRLDIRNVEYKAFDDPTDKADDDSETVHDWNDSQHHPDYPARNEYLAGINLHKILQRFDSSNIDAPLPTDLNALQTALLQSHPAQQSSESIVPPAWKRRSLSLQAATAITSSSDPLSTLQGISQNLPSIAHALSGIIVDESLKSPAREATDLSVRVGAVSPGWGDAPFGFYINSREVNLERPSFNIFQLLDVIREEDKKLRDLSAAVRPVMERTMGLLLGEGRGKGMAFKLLKDVRRAVDMGLDGLISYGKKSDESTNGEDGESEEESAPEKKYRIDVGRGGKKAIIYLNNIEKDPEYNTWPSLQEMMMRMQFGQGPTTKRNLFTMLIVVDPASGKGVHPAINIMAQLVNAQFPVRVGLLIVSLGDIELGEPTRHGFEDMSRPFEASDASAIIKHVAKKYGGMVAISCLVNVFQPHDGKVLSLREYINSYVEFLIQMNAVGADKEKFVREEIELILKFPEEGDETYSKAFEFAEKKLLRPGMSFFNGIPFPDPSDPAFASAVNQILRYEQQEVIGQVMQGQITDTKPKSLYASFLSGDNVYPSFHPLLRGGDAEYAPMSKESIDLSLMLPSRKNPLDMNDVDAFFVVELSVDLATIEGLNAAKSLLDLIHSAPQKWHDSKNVSVAFRIVLDREGLTGSPTKGAGYASLFCSGGRIRPLVFKRAIEIITDQSSFLSAINQIRRNEEGEFDEDSREALLDITKYVAKCNHMATLDKRNYYTINGRVYSPIEGPNGPFLTKDDVKMLVKLELDRTVGLTKLIAPKLIPKVTLTKEKKRVIHDAITLAATAVNHVFSKSETSALTQFSQKASSGITEVMDGVAAAEEPNPLYFSWNEEVAKKNLQLEVSVILDPLTEPTQRVAPLLIVIRDVLKLPLRLMIAPREVVENRLPLSSYYRFMLDPLAIPGINPPAALFSNLPSNHLLTVRLDVPETFDVQQYFAVQDADNLRCDSRYGCGDEAYVLANKGGEISKGSSSNGRVDLTQIEYTLKSLLFFGQCYDATTMSPPNGLQLTLDRSRLPLEQSGSEMQINPDGTTSEIVTSDVVQSDTSAHDHTDTLVMKTVGYWQLRANPGVWDLKIAENSRGAEIYHMVDGSLSPYGRLLVDKNATSFMSKSLIMKDFTDHRQLLVVKRNEGHESSKLFRDESELEHALNEDNETVHVFSLATGHAYERLLKIMMLSVTKRTKSPVKFWFFENFLSPSFKESALFMAEKIGCELEFVTYKWPEWLRPQTEKQRIIWGFKILFLDVLFPLDVKKVIYVDADQVVRGDMTELWNLDLEGAPYGYTPFCDSREETLGYQFWRTGFWKTHLQGKPYHISALYVVDLERFRRELVGDKLRAHYQQLSADPNSLANLDQDLPNYCQHDVRIFSLPQKWLWCESWCSDETKAEAMTIDLCNNPEHKEAKISMAKRIISGDLFEESWEELDAEVEKYYQEYLTFRQ